MMVLIAWRAPAIRLRCMHTQTAPTVAFDLDAAWRYHRDVVTRTRVLTAAEKRVLLAVVDSVDPSSGFGQFTKRQLADRMGHKRVEWLNHLLRRLDHRHWIRIHVRFGLRGNVYEICRIPRHAVHPVNLS